MSAQVQVLENGMELLQLVKVRIIITKVYHMQFRHNNY